LTEFTPDVPFPASKKGAPKIETVDAPLSKGEFFAAGRAHVDARREHLARMGMDARHVDALRMPAAEAPRAPPVHADALPEPNNATGVRKRPALAGVDFGIGGESDDDPQVGGAAGRRYRAADAVGQIDVGDRQ
jgi:hypothetical protein